MNPIRGAFGLEEMQRKKQAACANNRENLLSKVSTPPPCLYFPIAKTALFPKDKAMNESAALENQRRLVAALRHALEKASGQPAQLIETHISWVLVCADTAYKFKKALRFDFLDFSTLAARRFYCREELRLNRRLAPAIYLDVVAISGTPDQPSIEGGGEAIEYAVKMRAFEQQALWSHRLDNRLLAPEEIDALAQKVARFHLAIPSAPEESAWSTPAGLHSIAEDNLVSLKRLAKADETQQQLAELSAWQTQQEDTLRETFVLRKQTGYVRECHGDLHSNNILTWRGRVEVFDCIEFNESLRWIDVMNDLAFTLMDLEYRERPDLSARLLNRYLQESGDYEGLAVLRYYRAQRALVRAKVADLRAEQLEALAAGTAASEARRYLALAARETRPAQSALMITHGYSGSGKSVFSRALLELLGAVQIRSDLERKRMHGLSAHVDAGAAPGHGIYEPLATEATYRRLAALTRSIVASGLPVIVDAAFLKKTQRDAFAELARELEVPFLIFDLRADEAVLRARITARREQGGGDPSDASLEVLAHQLATSEPLSAQELEYCLTTDGGTESGQDTVQKIAAQVKEII